MSSLKKNGAIPDKWHRLYDFFFANYKARSSAHIWSILVSFLYGVLNGVVLHRPERRVTLELLGICVGVNLICVFVYCSRNVPSALEITVPQRETRAYWFGRTTLARSAAFISIAFIFSANIFPVGAIEPTIAVWRLERSPVGVIPGVTDHLERMPPKERFLKASQAINVKMREGIGGDPNSLNAAKSSLENAVEGVRLPGDVQHAAEQEISSLQAYETLSAVYRNPEYRRLSIIGAGEGQTTLYVIAHALTTLPQTPVMFSNFTVAGTPASEFLITNPAHSDAVVFQVTVRNLRQDIGNITWLNVTFEDSVIQYNGQPVRLVNVRFVNCQFAPTPDQKGQDLLNKISAHQGEYINVFVP